MALGLGGAFGRDVTDPRATNGPLLPASAQQMCAEQFLGSGAEVQPPSAQPRSWGATGAGEPERTLKQGSHPTGSLWKELLGRRRHVGGTEKSRGWGGGRAKDPPRGRTQTAETAGGGDRGLCQEISEGRAGWSSSEAVGGR